MVPTLTNIPPAALVPSPMASARFAMVNAGGGIYGRQLKLKNVHDDQLGNNRQAVQTAALTATARS